jgi:TPR repeat protein
MLKKIKYFVVAFCASFPLRSEDISPIEYYVTQHILAGQPAAAEKFLKTLEGMNSAEGIFWLGQYYLDGLGCEKDSKKATQYFQKAALMGFASALNALADSYLLGDGIEKDAQKALAYYEQAALKGHGPAQFNAGVLCKNGVDVPQNLKKAKKYLQMAARNESLGPLRQDAENIARLL